MRTKTPLYQRLYFQVLLAIFLGVMLGAFVPDLGAKMKPLGDAFIKLIKMMIAPIIFATVVVGIAKMGDMKEVGRVGVKALFYFEAVTTLALVIGLVVVNVLKPGAGLNVDPSTLDAHSVAKYAANAKEMSSIDFLMHIIPDTVVGAFANGEILQVLTFSVLLGLALTKMGDNGKTIVHILDEFSHALFGVINMLMKLAPIGAFGAMAFTIGKYGVGSLKQLGFLMLCVYLTCFAFVFVVLGTIAKLNGFSLWSFLVYIKEELLLVLGTSSSESALPGIMKKLENLGCSKPVVGMVIPTGYSFNLDGTSIYLTMAAIFIAQATNVDLTLAEELGLLGVLLLTSKGAAAVTGGGFITLAATLATLGGKLPVSGLALLIGIDRFMSEARAITNLIGNGVATIVVARWEKALDEERMRRVLAGEPVLPEEPAAAPLPAQLATAKAAQS